MVVLENNGATYWVVNTLLGNLSNETMLTIAKGLQPHTHVRRLLERAILSGVSVER